MQRSTSKRDKAILLTLLDTGLRAGELCALRVGDVDFLAAFLEDHVAHGSVELQQRGV